MANSKSDYKKSRFNIFERAPEVLQSDTMQSVLENVHNRLLTKSESERVVGTIGVKNNASEFNTQIPEVDVHRQGYQLQPLLYKKIATVDHLTSHKDILRKATQLGIDVDQIPSWGNTEQFNFAPPIDLDKFVNYSDYYWYDPDDSTSVPQYITIKDRCVVAKAKTHQKELEIYSIGQLHSITSVSVALNHVTVSSDLTSLLPPTTPIKITGTAAGLNDGEWTVDSSTYDTFTNITTITTVEDILYDTSSSGSIDLQPIVDQLNAEQNCFCASSSFGWDIKLFDDNGGDWEQPGDDAERIAIGAPLPEGVHSWDQSDTCVTADEAINQWVVENKWVHKLDITNVTTAQRAELPIIEYADTLQLNRWTYRKPNWLYRANSIESWVVSTTEPDLVEMTPGYEIVDVNTATDTFIVAGDLTGTFVSGFQFTVADSDCFDGYWTTLSSTFVFPNTHVIVQETIGDNHSCDATIAPSTQIEVIDPFNNTFKVAGDFTFLLPPAASFVVSNAGSINGTYTVMSSVFAGSYTTITTVEDIIISTNSNVVPLVQTSKGDAWNGFYQHWVFNGFDDTTSVDLQTVDPSPVYEEWSITEPNQLFTLDAGTDIMTLSSPAGATWVTGTEVILSSTDYTLSPLNSDRIYYLIRLSATQYNLSITREDAINGVFVNIIGAGVDSHTVRTTNREFTLASSTFLAQSNTIRVYVNGVRQYGTYAEGLFVADDPSTIAAVGDWLVDLDVTENQIIDSILFSQPQDEFLTVRIETSPAALSEVGRESLLVRDTTNPVFTPTRQSLVRYHLVEQVKTEHTQYPLFDIFNVDGTTAYAASPIFVFKENSAYAIEPRVGNRRLEILNGGKDPIFEQLLVDETDGTMYCYIDSSSIDGDNVLGLQTIWRSSKVLDEYIQYVPRYVNADRLADGDLYIDENNEQQVASVAPGAGDWEVPNQLFFNASHENRKELAFSEIVTHFQSMVNNQPIPTGYTGNQSTLYRTLYAPNYGVGGIIKEHNYEYDVFLSSLFVTNGTPLSIIDFAHSQYSTSINVLKEAYKTNLTSYLTNLDEEFITDMGMAIANNAITAIELNDAQSLLYGDSTTYNETLGVGIHNWIATLPFIGLAFKQQPEVLLDPELDIVEVLHHDGHRSQITIDSSTQQKTLAYLRNTTHPDSGTAKWATQGIFASRPSDYLTLKRGEYYYATDESVLYRFNVVAISSLAPSSSLPDGTLWLRNTDGKVLVRDSGDPSEWVLAGGTGDIEHGWIVVNLRDVFANALTEVETRLYEAAPNLTDLVFDYTSLTPGAPEQAMYDALLEDAFLDYAHTRNITNPYAKDYSASDAFTWNYKNVDYTSPSIVQYPTVDSLSNTPWGSRWQSINEGIFGTPYPHLEPWKLQSYSNKPTWWDEEYKDITNVRRWIPSMWTNIQNGDVPATRTYPDGSISTGNHTVDGQSLTQYSHFSVNITADTTTDGYGPDDLLPPYWIPPTGSAEDLAVASQALIQAFVYVIQPDDDYIFADIGPIEWEWRHSSHYLYSLASIAFKMQPVRFLHYTFGTEFWTVGGLNVDKRTSKVYSHVDTIFHGTLLDDNTVYQSNGLNQWYVNYNRYNSFDNRTSDFVSLWTEWEPTYGYQMGTFVDTESLNIAARYFDIIEQDYSVTIKKVPGFADYWLDSLQITATSIPRKSIRFDNENAWEFTVNVPSPVSRRLTYYPVESFSFTVNTTSNVCTLSAFGETMPWPTGTYVYVQSTENMPVPLEVDVGYYVTVLTNTTFTLSELPGGVPIDLTSVGSGTLAVFKSLSLFTALDGANTDNTWKHISVDKRTTKETTTPFIITGMQNVINFIDGYSAYLEDIGFVFNNIDATTELDHDTGRIVSWNVETERFIDYMYSVRSSNYNNTSLPTYVPSFEVNPIRNNVWFNNELGIISNISHGPYTDIRTEQTAYDQYGRLIDNRTINVYRLDSLGHILLRTQAQNDIEPATTDPYNYIHIGGIHLFVDGYEHSIIFNNYTIEDSLIYDPFLGLNTERFRLQFSKQPEFTQRPNVGGYFLHKNTLKKNFESNLLDVQQIYDTFDANENAITTKYGRQLLGYSDPSYLDHLGIDEKSKFLFWRGLIQNKGSVNSVTAFINSRKFIDAKVDEFWAYKVAEFGDSREVSYPEIKLTLSDSIRDTLRLHFTTTNVSNTLEAGFVEVSSVDQSRWVNYPNQAPVLNDGSVNIGFDAEVTATLVNPTPIPTTDYFELPTPCDGVNITFDNGYSKTVAAGGVSTTMIVAPYILQSNNIVVYVDGIKTTDFVETDTTTITFSPALAGTETVVVLRQPGLLTTTGYSVVNSRLLNIPAATVSAMVDFTIYCLNPAKSKLTPGKLVDYKSNTTVNNIPVWDPAKNDYYHQAVNVVDITSSSDPAKYSTTLDASASPLTAWNKQEQGLVWLNNLELGYVPYFDAQIYTSAEDRIQRWGTMAEWANVEINEWTESTVPPDEYTDLVLEQEGDITIPENKRASGVARKILYKRERDSDTFTIQTWQLAEQLIQLNSSLLSSVEKNDPTGLTFSTYSFITSINGSPMTISIDGTRAQTYNGLLNEINSGLLGLATATLSNTVIDGIEEVSSVTTVADVAGNLAGKYFTIDSPTTSYYVWYTVSAVGADPAPGGTAIGPVDVATNATADDVALATQITLNNHMAFDATVNTNVVTVTNSVIGNTPDATVGDSGFAVATLVQGTVITTEIGILIKGNTTNVQSISLANGITDDLFSPVNGLSKNGVSTFVAFATATSAQDSLVTALSTGTLVPTNNLPVFLQTTGTLPTPLVLNQEYYFVSIGSDYGLSDSVGGDPIEVLDVGTGTHTFMRTEFTTNNLWEKEINHHDEFITVVATATGGATAQITNLNITIGDIVQVYVNGYYNSDILVGAGLDAFVSAQTPQSIIHIVKTAHVATDEELAFDPEEDDGTYLIQYKEDYEYTTVTRTDVNGIETSMYYFWVTDKTLRGTNKSISLKEATNTFITSPRPYMFFQKLIKSEAVVDLDGKTIVYPDRYTQAISTGLTDKISEEDRYKLVFTKNFTLRDNIEDASTAVSLKNVHTEWQLFREKQPYHITRALWDKLTEGMAGYKLSTIGTLSPEPIPSVERVMYDDIYHTTTQYGFGEGQTFADSTILLNTIQDIIQDSNFDISPLNKEDFLNDFFFDTPENIKTTMDYIFNNFKYEDVNELFFAGLMDAMSHKNDYADVFKTSMIALHGIRILETAGSVTDY